MPVESATRKDPSFASRASIAFSVVDLFTIGIGPSSSHTVGPMRAARRFVENYCLAQDKEVLTVECELFGSLALTGRGHATDIAVILGLLGFSPEEIDPATVSEKISDVETSRRLLLGRRVSIPFDRDRNMVFHMHRAIRFHPNGMLFRVIFVDGAVVEREFFSIGGGAIVEGRTAPGAATTNISLPYSFSSAAELLEIGEQYDLTIPDIARINETAWRTAEETNAFLDEVRAAMFACIDRGCREEGTLPGGLQVKRRAKNLFEDLKERGQVSEPAIMFQWVSLWALATNEENAAGGRVVTAPTNGAAGVIPAVLRYYECYTPNPSIEGSRDFLLTAAAIGALYKKRASISAAEMGCQGEVGVACSMAAAGLAAVLGASNRQIENAAEIGMEHNLGLTCDPIRGLVQIPCIERNTMGAIKAINAAYLAIKGDGGHIVSLDSVIETMRQTGVDMRSKYKETSLGGLAVNVVEC